MSSKDIKTLSLNLYGTEVEIIFKENSCLFTEYDGSLKGTLAGRFWGEELQEGIIRETVIGVTLNTAWGKKNINSEDILLIKSTGAEVKEARKQAS
jgi:hypothetical protein